MDALKKRELVVAIMAKGIYEKRTLYCPARSYARRKDFGSGSGQYRTQQSGVDLSLIMNEARKGAGAGGPFWAIGKKGA